MLHLMSRRSFLLATVGGFALLALPGCESFAGNAVVIYSCAEGVRNESLLTALRSRFPSYDIRLRYVPTGNCAAKLKMEGSRSEADIVLDLEGGYIEQISDQLEDLSGFDSSRYCSDLLDPDGRYFPFARESACIAVSRGGPCSPRAGRARFVRIADGFEVPRFSVHAEPSFLWHWLQLFEKPCERLGRG